MATLSSCDLGRLHVDLPTAVDWLRSAVETLRLRERACFEAGKLASLPREERAISTKLLKKE